MFKLAICLQKGGVGKTTTALCLGGALAVRGKKVIIIDLDPQANATRSLAIEPTVLQNEGKLTIYDLVTKKVSVKDVIIQTEYGIDLIPSTPDLTLAEPKLSSATGAKILLRHLMELEQLGEANSQWKYDYAIIDCPPSLSGLTVNALTAAEGVIAPLNCEHYAEQGLNDFLQTFNGVKLDLNSKLDAPMILFNMYKGIKTHKDVVENVRDIMAGHTFQTIISNRAVLTEVGVRGPIQAYAPTSDSSKEYKKLADEVEQYAQKHRR